MTSAAATASAAVAAGSGRVVWIPYASSSSLASVSESHPPAAVPDACTRSAMRRRSRVNVTGTFLGVSYSAARLRAYTTSVMNALIASSGVA